jgi:hypothetical protein
MRLRGSHATRRLQEARLQVMSRLESMRGAMGELQERTPKAIGFVTNMPEAPPGYYAGAFFESKFAHGTVDERGFRRLLAFDVYCADAKVRRACEAVSKPSITEG